MELLRFKKDQKYLILDFETCNLNLLPGDDPLNLPWQLGWQVYEGSKLIESHEDWIWWDSLESKMGRDAAAITGFNSQIYQEKAKDPAPILENFEKYLFDPSVISVTANGVNFDAYIYNIYRAALKKKPNWSWIPRHYDIQCVQKAKILGISPPPINTDEWTFFSVKMSQIKRKGMKVNLAHLCREYGVEYNEFRHHKEALYDSELVMGVMKKQIQTIDIYSI